MQQFKRDMEVFATKLNSRDATIDNSTLKEIICVLETVVNSIVGALPENTSSAIRITLSALSSILSAACKML